MGIEGLGPHGSLAAGERSAHRLMEIYHGTWLSPIRPHKLTLAHTRNLQVLFLKSLKSPSPDRTSWRAGLVRLPSAGAKAACSTTMRRGALTSTPCASQIGTTSARC